MKRADVDAYFKKVQEDLSNKLTEAEELLALIKSTIEEASSNRKEGAETLSEINKNYQQVAEIVNKIQTDLSTVADLRATALDPKTGIEIIISKVQAVSDKSNAINTEIEEIRKSVSSSQSDIKKLLEAATKDRQRLENNASEANETLGKINEIYQLATDTGLAGSFDKRKSELEPMVWGWRTRFTGSLVLLGVVLAAVLGITFFVDGIKLDGLTVIRFALLTPLAVYVAFSALQYSKERVLLEKYAFKATTALALESYTKLLVEKFENKKFEKDILSFVLNAMGDIYKEPHEVRKKTRWNFTAGSKHSAIKGQLVGEFEKLDKKIDVLDNKIAQSKDSRSTSSTVGV